MHDIAKKNQFLSVFDPFFDPIVGRLDLINGRLNKKMCVCVKNLPEIQFECLQGMNIPVWMIEIYHRLF